MYKTEIDEVIHLLKQYEFKCRGDESTWKRGRIEVIVDHTYGISWFVNIRRQPNQIVVMERGNLTKLPTVKHLQNQLEHLYLLE